MTNKSYPCIVAPSSRHSTSFTSTSTSTSLTSTLTSTSTSISPSSHSSQTDASAIIGGAIGSAFGGALILALLFWLYTKRGASRPDLETSSEHKITNPPPSTGLSPVPSPPASTDSPTPVQQAYPDAFQNTYVSIRCLHLTCDADMNTVGSRRYSYILYNPAVQKRGPAGTAS